jgi:predicted dinucleotide-binding enzyme
MLSFSRSDDTLRNTAAALGSHAGTPLQAAEFGHVVTPSTKWANTAEAIRQIGSIVETKVLWDCTNPMKPDMSGLLIGTTTSGGEEVAKLAPWAKVVKAIPPFAEQLHSPSALTGGIRPAVFVCGDDAEARKTIAGLVEVIGAAPIDVGPLMHARYTEPACMLLVQLAYTQSFGTQIGLTLAAIPS